jgi:hypothetical protein
MPMGWTTDGITKVMRADTTYIGISFPTSTFLDAPAPDIIPCPTLQRRDAVCPRMYLFRGFSPLPGGGLKPAREKGCRAIRNSALKRGAIHEHTPHSG